MAEQSHRFDRRRAFVLVCLVITASVRAHGQSELELNPELYDTGSSLTKIINEAFNRKTHSKIHLKKGKYLIDSLVLKTGNMTINGNQSELILNNTSRKPFLILIKARNITLTNFVFRNRRATADNIDAVRVNNSENVRIERCDITGFKGKGIDIAFSNRIYIDGNTVSFCGQGIQFWGGDAKQSAGQPFVNTIFVRNNIVHDIKGGGIWGSCGKNIVFEKNTVSRCNDVGIDFEKCYSSRMFGNIVSDCKNACISFFYGCRNIVASENTIFQRTFSGHAIKFFNSQFVHQNISIRANKISSIANYAIWFDKSAASDIQITGNKIEGSLRGIKSIDCNSIRIDSNSISLEGGNMAINNEGGCYWMVNNNIIRNTVGHSPGNPTIGIRMYYRSATFFAGNSNFNSNLISGFTASILEDNWGHSSSAGNSYANNILDSFYVTPGKESNTVKLQSNRVGPDRKSRSKGVQKFNNKEFKQVL